MGRPSVDWSRFGAVVVRTTWDYHRRLDEFRAWDGPVVLEVEVIEPSLFLHLDAAAPARAAAVFRSLIV